jgi:hypothetical protein
LERVAGIAADGDQDAIASLAAYQQFQQKAASNAQEAAKRDAETQRLITEARQPATVRAVAVADARQAAFTVAATGAAQSQAAARAALVADDDSVLAWVTTGIEAAAAEDDRTAVQTVALNGNPDLSRAAQAALGGTDSDVVIFLRDQNYPERATDDRIEVNQILADANAAQNTVTAQRAQAALDGDDAARRAFLKTGQFAAADVDQRVQVNRILAAADPNSELAARANSALKGPPGGLQDFLTTGQYAAAINDQDAQAHNEEMLALLRKGQAAAQTAVQGAGEAQSIAATARKDATAAQDWANKAAQAAQQAKAYYDQASASADRAEAAATAASASYAKAADAAAKANAAAAEAGWQARRAERAYSDATDAASDAIAAGERARQSAIAAGKSRSEVELYYAQTVLRYNTLYDQEKKTVLIEQYAACMKEGLPTADFERKCFQVYEPDGLKAAKASINREFCNKLAHVGDDYYQNCVADSFNPLFMFNRSFDMVVAEVAQLSNSGDAMGFLGLGIISMMCAAVCAGGLAVLGGAEMSMGVGGLFDLWIGEETLNYLGGAALAELGGLKLFDELKSELGGLRLSSVVDRTRFPGLALDSNLARDILKLPKCLTNSFVAGTRVTMADGTTKPIEDVRVGDRVWSADPAAGESGPDTVTQLIRSTARKDLADIVTAGGTVTATANHRVWAADLGEWLPAGNLRAGQLLRTTSGTWVQVGAVRHYSARSTVYNFSVAGRHSYFVSAGGSPFLVHNDPSCDTALGIGKFTDGTQGLAGWADGMGFQHYMGPEYRAGTPQLWIGKVLSDVSDPGKTIRVRIVGFRDEAGSATGDPAARFEQAARNGGLLLEDAQATEREMSWLARALFRKEREWGSVFFYDTNGRVIIDKEPDWWNLVPASYPRPAGINQPADLTARDIWQRYLNRDRWADEHGF